MTLEAIVRGTTKLEAARQLRQPRRQRRPGKSGLLQLSSNSPVNWTAARHVVQGNVALADGSVQGFIAPKLRSALGETGVATNRLLIP